MERGKCERQYLLRLPSARSRGAALHAHVSLQEGRRKTCSAGER